MTTHQIPLDPDLSVVHVFLVVDSKIGQNLLVRLEGRFNELLPTGKPTNSFFVFTPGSNNWLVINVQMDRSITVPRP